MKLTKVTQSTLILFFMTVFFSFISPTFHIEIARYGTMAIIFTPVAVIFLYQSLDFSKSPFKLNNFTIKKGSLIVCSISFAIGIYCILIISVSPNIFNNNLRSINSILLLGSAGFLITMAISFLQIFLSMDEIMSIAIDKKIFVIFIAILILNLLFYGYLPEDIKYIGAIALFTLLPFILLLRRSLESREAFVPNFLMSLSFLTAFISSIIFNYLKQPSSLVILFFYLSISLVIIAIDQAKEIAKTQPITDNLDQQQ